jgi:cell wall-associated NlpC family hydrolase
MRSEPSHQSELVSQLLYGDCFKITSKKKGWLQITALADQYSGWIDEKQATSISKSDAEKITIKTPLYSTRLVDYIETPDGELTALVLGSNIGACKWLGHQYDGPTQPKKMDKSKLLKTASLYLNAPYLWGGKTPMGIDCSGLTQMTYRINGLSIPRDASLQAQLGETLSFIDESEAGDLAFFDDAEGKIIHVGLLLENHYILHAHGKVRIDRIDQTGIYNTKTQQHSHKLRIIKKLV